MNKTPLTNMDGYKVKATSESYDALIELGYIDTVMDKETRLSVYDPISLFVEPTGIINSSSNPKPDKKQAYYHNGHFYDEPYEEFTITEDKVPFPELGDIEEFIEPKWLIKLVWSFGAFIDGKSIREVEYENLKIAYENGVPVTWKLKEKINYKLHENRPLALAISRLMVETAIVIECDYGYLNAVVVFKNGKTSFIFSTNGTLDRTDECTLPEDYIIPNQVLQWMKEYQEQGIK